MITAVSVHGCAAGIQDLDVMVNHNIAPLLKLNRDFAGAHAALLAMLQVSVSCKLALDPLLKATLEAVARWQVSIHVVRRLLPSLLFNMRLPNAPTCS